MDEIRVSGLPCHVGQRYPFAEAAGSISYLEKGRIDAFPFLLSQLVFQASEANSTRSRGEPLAKSNYSMPTLRGLTRRKVMAGIAAAAAAPRLQIPCWEQRMLRTPSASSRPAPTGIIPADPSGVAFETLEVGPGKRFASLTLAGCFMNSISRWNNGYADPIKIAKMGFRLIVSPGPPGYYTNDSGSHSRRWPSLVGWPPYEGTLLGPVIIEGEPGKPAPVLDTDGYADGVLYYQTGLFATGSFDATFRHLIFRGFRRQDGIGNYSAVRLGQPSGTIPIKKPRTI